MAGQPFDERDWDAAGYDVVLLPTFAHVEDWRKRRASACAGGLFSQAVTTWGAWIADLWELHGDGRAIVDSLQRNVIMQAAFDREAGPGGVVQAAAAGAACEGAAGEPDLAVSPGVVSMAVRCAREAAGVPAFEQALDRVRSGSCPPGLALREMAFLQGIARYRELLCSTGLVEAGQAAAWLAARSDQVFARPLRVLVAGGGPLDWRTAAFFDACGNVSADVREAPGANGVQRMPEGVLLGFGFPAGRYAQPALVADIVREALDRHEGGREGAGQAAPAVLVAACKDPLALCRDLEPAFAREGVALSVQARVPFASTDFGRCFLQLHRALSEEVWSPNDVSDAVRPPFSGFSGADARIVDTRLRADRIARFDDVLAALRATSDTFSQLEEVACDPDANILLGVFDQIAVTAPERTDAWRAEQVGAVSALRSCTSAARRVGADMAACVRVLENCQVPVSYECAAGEAGSPPARLRLVVATHDAAAQMGPRSCDTLMLCDLSSEDFPVADRDDAARTLFEKLGMHPADSALARMRRTFWALQCLPERELVCIRPLNDFDGNPTYPAAMLQELVDSYRADPTDDSDLDEVYGLPAALLEHVRQRGEELLFANAAACAPDGVQAVACADAARSLGDIPAGDAPKVALSRRSADGSASLGFAPSPSQVEAYLDCPYKWFAQSRLGVTMLDEGFGALERGSYAHAVLQDFYRRFRNEGFAKVNAGNLEHARDLMREVAGELERAQYDLPPGSGRYVAADQMEQRLFEAAKGQLVSYLDFEAAFLPGFHPAHLEYAIAPESGVSYAGRPFVGIVDRIDVDDAGNAVVIDYKGSVNASHAIAGKSAADPGKVQARMYAQVVRRVLGLNVVGALYVSYGKAHGCAGAVDAVAIDAAHLPFTNVQRSRCALSSSAEALEQGDFAQMSFTDMLDRTERLVEDAIASMEAGNVEPHPASPDSCAYCPCASCPGSGA